MKIQNGLPLRPASPEVQSANREGQLRDAAKMYENHFLNEMVKAMRSTVHRDEGFTKPNFAEKIFSEQLDQQYVDGWSERGGVGLADIIYTQLHDKFFATKQKGLSLPGKTFPVAPQKQPGGLPVNESIQLKQIPADSPTKSSYRIEVQGPVAGHFDVLAPFAGDVVKKSAMGDGWQIVELDHGQGLLSELTFPGQGAEIVIGDRVEVGQRLGELNPASPVLAWNLDWTDTKA